MMKYKTLITNTAVALVLLAVNFALGIPLLGIAFILVQIVMLLALQFDLKD
jgi:hypothetical protein